ncbi:asparagine synthase-related protein [Dyella sp.]|uniref:asparagine synthase-related protein n=1 Tax=Dyella sp. TaxID=1869338 RepID=UPI002ED11307
MLKARITLCDLLLEATRQGESIVFGGSHITAHAHALLESVLVKTRGQWFFVVRERLAAGAIARAVQDREVSPETFGKLYNECLLWPLDYVLIEVAQAGCRMRLRSGVLGSVPVYCRATHDKATVSWDFTDLATGSTAVDTEIAAHRLAMHTVYSARQLYVGVHLLTERATLDIEPGKASFRYPTPIQESIPSPLADDIDALQVFGSLLQRVVSSRPLMTGRLALELSGGMDSASVACALASRYVGIASKGILLDGEVRQPQVERRQWIVERLGLHDETVEISAFPPIIDLQQMSATSNLYWEYYLEACAALWSLARSQGRDTLFTGIGGDELFPSYLNEMPGHLLGKTSRAADIQHCALSLLTPRALGAANSLRGFDAPLSPVPATSLLAHACRAPDLLRHGMWPVNPLSDPNLVAFCHRLPRGSRQGRELMRQYLESHLGSNVFARDYTKETFADVLPGQIALHADTLAIQLRECALADLGLINHKAVLALLDTVVVTRAQAPTAALASFLWLERGVRQIGRAMAA